MTAPSTTGPGARRTRLLLVGALVVLLGGLGVWAALRGSDPGPPSPGTVAATPSGDPAASASPPAESPAPPGAAAEDAAGDGSPQDVAPGGAAAEPPPVAGPDPSGLETVAPREVPVLPSVPLSEPADFGNRVTARLASVARVDGEGQGPGERSGPAVLVRVELRNDTPDPLTVDYVVVDLTDGAGTPGSALFGDPRSAPFSGSLEPGASRVGDYVLRLPDGATDPVTVTVSYGAEAPTAVFTGPVPTG